MPSRNARALTVALAVCACAAAAPQAPAGVNPLTVKKVAGGLNRPIFVTHAPGDETRLFIMEQRGVIKILDLASLTVLPTAFLDIDALVAGPTSDFDERGLLGLAFHPDYDSNGFFYVYYTNNSSNAQVSRYTISGNPNVADSASAVSILTIGEPQVNHNGGWMGFGPNDGHLYIAVGDGGGGCDDEPGHTVGTGNGQDTSTLLGKMLRIDPSVAVGGGYTNPADNPFVGVAGADEIWAYGLRNPWRDSFDRDTGDFFIADVGQSQREEVNYQKASSTGGHNYGWRCFEGTSCSTISGCLSTPCGCVAPAGNVFPIHEYTHAQGISITGGYMYRGCDIPTFRGHYIFGDYGSTTIWTFELVAGHASGLTDRTAELEPPGADTINSVASFGEDARGEIYIVDRAGTTTGEIYRIILQTGWADFNCDDVVGVDDMLDLFAHWGLTGAAACPWDPNRDGAVNVDDFLLLFVQWGPIP